MTAPSAYTVADYGAMIVDPVRMDRYVRALEQAVRPDAVVVDIGTGTGIFALLACRFGARRVYAIEADDVIQVAREIAAANGCADRIEFIQAMSTKVTLPEPADVIISDLTGALPWFMHHVPSIIDARRRLLRSGGVLIPRKDMAWAAIVSVGELYRRWTGPWNGAAADLDMAAARRIIVNTITSVHLTDQNLLTEPRRWGVTDYATVEDADVRERISWTVARSGAGHGFAAGFDRTLADGIWMSNAPDAPEADRPTIYPTLLFPWPAPVDLAPGDRITVDLDATLTRHDYIWSWKTHVTAANGCDKAAFSQSTFYGWPLSPGTLRQRAASTVPSLSEEGRIACAVLDAMNEGVPLGEIAKRIAAGFASRFPRPGDALSFVVDLSRRYSAGEQA
jgi:type I protein arginine methyltransferase